MTYKILYVDDELNMEDIIRQRLRRRIRKGDLDLAYADNGKNALEKLKERGDIQIMFTDINMPEMDGLELLEHVNKDYPDIYTIVVSAYSDMDNIRSAMNSGAYDFVTKPIDFDDFNSVLSKAIAAYDEKERTNQLEHDLLSIKHEMDYAGRLQSRILPLAFPEHQHFEIYGSMTPARDIGGDFYDVFDIGRHQIGFLIADVSGKGISAAIFMAISRTIFHVTAHSLEEISTEEIINTANNMICKENHDSFFVTMQCCLLNTETGELKYSNAGHMPPIIISADGSVKELHCNPNIVVGIMDSFDFEQHTYTMQPGDIVYLYTDGVSEAHNEKGEIYTTKRLIDSLSDIRSEGLTDLTPKTLIKNIWNRVTQFRGNADQYDDITQVALKYK